MFVHLNVHTEYSLLNGAIRIPDLIKKAKEFQMPAVAMTDYGNLFGGVEFFQEAKKSGIKPIIGCTVYHPSNDDHTLRVHRRGVDAVYQLVLLVQNDVGYKNLCKLVTQSYLHGFYYKPRVDSKLLQTYSEGLIALSGGWDGAINQLLFEGKTEQAQTYCEQYASIFKDRFYIELQNNGVEGQVELNRQLVVLAEKNGLPYVATNNCHYLNREDAEAFETLICIQTGARLHGANDHLKYTTDGYYFKSPEEMKADFADTPQAIEETLRLVDRCNFEYNLKTYYFPKFTPPENKTLDEYLHDQAFEGFEKRWPQILKNRGLDGTTPADLEKAAEWRKHYEARLELELDVIKKMGFSGYFLIVSDFIIYAKTHDVPVGPGRGSAAGSLVAYCVQITDLDPIPYNLLFERFLNPERISMPDVDIDFCMNRRERVLEYVNKKYGNVSQIITFGKMKAKAVLRDVGRVMDMPYEEVDKIAKLVPNALNITLKEALEQEPRLTDLAKESPQIARLLEIAKKLEGLNRHASTHAAGVVISDQSLDNYLPLYKGGNNDIVTQYDMKAVEKVGLIKFDFLGLKTLTVIDDAVKLAKKNRDVDLDILNISLSDPAVYELLSRGDATAVFQLESEGMKDLLIRMAPSCFEDLVALVALYRPGPLGSGMVDDFINRKQGKTPIQYELPQLSKILEDTYGVIVYQEQVMQIASALAGYSLGEADLLRRAMGKKKAEEMAAQRERFIHGAKEKKIDLTKAEKIFDLMAMFAEYGFNKSHSAAYALVSYQTAFLKTHYRVEYMAAVMSNEMHDTDRIQFYLNDVLQSKIKVLPPDVNKSEYTFSVMNNSEMRYGLGALKGVGEGAIQSIVEEREAHGPYTSFFNFCSRVDLHRVNKRVIESLVKSGAFDTIHPIRSQLFAMIEPSMTEAARRQAEKERGQSSLFGLMEVNTTAPIGLTLSDCDEWIDNEKLGYEKEAMGFYFSGHPLKTYEAQLKEASLLTTRQCGTLQNEAEVLLAGIMTSTKVITTKKGKRMAFVNFEDLFGSMEVIFFSDSFGKYVDLIGSDKPFVLKGVCDRSEEGVKIIARELTLLTDYLSQKTKSVHFKIPASNFNQDKAAQLLNLLKTFEGACRGYLHLMEEGKCETVLELPKGINLKEQELLAAKVNSLFSQKVVEYKVA